MNSIGVDIGGTKIAFALVDGQGDVLAAHELPTEAHKGLTAVLSQVQKGIAALDAPADVPVGVGCPGFIHQGIVLTAANLNWQNVPVQALLQERLPGRVVTVENDVRAALIGEWQYGAGRGYEDVIQFSIGTGLGAAALCGGRLLLGKRSAAMEVGQIRQAESGERFEMRASGLGLKQIFKDLHASHETDLPLESRTHDILQAYHAGDAFAGLVMAAWLNNIEEAVIWLCTVLNPELLIISGGLGLAAYDILQPQLAEAVARRADPMISASVKILSAQVQSSAVGAAALTRLQL